MPKEEKKISSMINAIESDLTKVMNELVADKAIDVEAKASLLAIANTAMQHIRLLKAGLGE